MTKNILVGFDGSPESNEALLWAAAEAAARERPLEIVSCYRLPMATDAYTGTPPDATAAILETVSGEATKARDAVVAPALSSGRSTTPESSSNRNRGEPAALSRSGWVTWPSSQRIGSG